MTTTFLVSYLTGFAYIACMQLIISDTSKKLYHQLFKTKTFLIHFACALFLGAIGIYQMLHNNEQTCFLLVPLLYILCLQCTDWIVRSNQDRHVILAARYDKRPATYKWWLDGVFTVLLIVTPIMICMFLPGYIMKHKSHKHYEGVKIDVKTN